MTVKQHRIIQWIAITLILSLGAGWYYQTKVKGAQTVNNDTPSFQADLKSTLDLQAGVGKPTFTRATTATVTDFEGLIKNVKSGEARFEGARRVENLAPNSNSISGWSTSGSLSEVTGQTDPFGGIKATKVTSASANSDLRMTNIIPSGGSGRVSFWARADAPFSFAIGNNVSNTYLSITTSWQRFSGGVLTGSTNVFIGGWNTWGNGVSIYLYGLQVENVTGQANQNPSEYVSTNIFTSAPYHGANVDGVKYFTTYNGNTVASNVVTEATGASIPDATLHGYVAEGARTNLALQSENFSTSWTTSASAYVANNVVSPGGGLTAGTVTIDNTLMYHGNYQNVAVSSGATMTYSRYIKAGTQRYLSFGIANGGTNNVYMAIDTQTWTITQTGAGGVGVYVSSSLVSVGNGWYRATITGSLTGLTSYSIVLYGCANSTPGNASTQYTGDGVSTIISWGAQIESGSFASSYIPTTSASVTRNGDVLTYPSANNLSVLSPYSIYTEAIAKNPEGASIGSGATWQTIIGSNLNYAPFLLVSFNPTSSVYFYSNTNGIIAQIARSNSDKQTLSRYAIRRGNSVLDIFVAGVKGTSSASLGTQTAEISNINIGMLNSNSYLYGTIRNVKIWKKALTDTQLTNMTSTNTSVSQSAVKQTTVGADGSSFQADLKSTLDLQAGVGKPTFTRATTATVTDFEGLIKNVKSGEARFEGARRVENLVTYSEDLTNASWVKANGTATSAGVADGYNLTKFTLTGGSSQHYPQHAFTANANSVIQTSMYVDVSNLTTKKIIATSFRRDGSLTKIEVAWTGPTTVSFSASLNTLDYGFRSLGSYKGVIYMKYNNMSGAGAESAFWYIGVFGSYSGDGEYVLFSRAMVEDVTGQANQNPSEYVSTNVKTSTPYHGANVDGVKYFTTYNGNTVASNVVTEATGAAIPDATLHGYVAEGARTNLALQSETFDNASWTKVASSVTANSTVSPDGKTTTDKIIESVGGSIHGIAANYTLSSGAYSLSIYAKASERTSFTMQANVSPTQSAIFNLSTGTVTSGTGTITNVGGGWFRCTLLFNSSGGFFTLYPGYYSVSGDGTSGIYLWGAQLEAGAFASSYIPTTTASVTRNADVLTYPSSGNASYPLSGYAEFAPRGAVNQGGPVRIVSVDDGTNNNRSNLFVGITSLPDVFVVSGDVVQADVIAPSQIILNTKEKYAFVVASNDARLYRNGASIGTPDTSATVPGTPTIIRIGDWSSGSGQPFGTIRNVKIWKKALTDTQLTNMTSSDADVSAGAIQQTVVNDSQNTKLTSGLVGLWSFDGLDAIGTAMYDRSGQGHNGMLTNGPTKTIGRVIQAISFDGIDDSIAIGTGYNGVKTISFWVKPNSTTQSIIDFNGTQTVDISAGTVRGNSFTSPTIYIDGTATATFPDTDWHFVTITTGTGINASAFTIGKIASAYLNGSIDEVRLYSRVLSVAEVSALYNLGR